MDARTQWKQCRDMPGIISGRIFQWQILPGLLFSEHGNISGDSLAERSP